MEAEDWDEPKKNSIALLCMVGLGVGELVGSTIFARMQDTCGMTVTLGVLFIMTVIAGTLNIIYAVIFVFNIYLCIAMVFVFGVQDACIVCLINTMCGFEFESKTVPFSVMKFSQSIFIFLIFYLESFLKTREHHIYYFSF